MLVLIGTAMWHTNAQRKLHHLHAIPFQSLTFQMTTRSNDGINTDILHTKTTTSLCSTEKKKHDLGQPFPNQKTKLTLFHFGDNSYNFEALALWCFSGKI